MRERERPLELKKHVAAIHSSNKLTLVQRKIANALLFNAYDELLTKEEYQIHIKTLCNLIGYDSNDSKTIKKALVNLLSTVIEWNLVDGTKLNAEGVWNASSIIADASIDGAVCTYSYSNKMKKLLYCPELYGRLSMVIQAKFQSSYGLALYENCIRFQNIDQTPWFSLTKFRQLMGVDEGKYVIFRDFKRRVLDKAMEEVNKYAPIYVTSKFQKQGRQVTAIQFLIKRVKELPIMEEGEVLTVTTLSQQLKNTFGFSKHQIEETLSHYEEKYIREKITVIENSTSFVNGKIGNLAQYLLHALQGDYQLTKSSKHRVATTRTVLSVSEKLPLNPSMNLAYRRYQHTQLIEKFYTESSESQKKISQEFEKSLGSSLYYDIYMRDGLSNVLVVDQLCDFLKNKRPAFLSVVQPFEEFVLSRST